MRHLQRPLKGKKNKSICCISASTCQILMLEKRWVGDRKIIYRSLDGERKRFLLYQEIIQGRATQPREWSRLETPGDNKRICCWTFTNSWLVVVVVLVGKRGRTVLERYDRQQTRREQAQRKKKKIKWIIATSWDSLIGKIGYSLSHSLFVKLITCPF